MTTDPATSHDEDGPGADPDASIDPATPIGTPLHELPMERHIRRLAIAEERALAMGGPERVAAHHAKGRWTVRERLDALFDVDTFTEFGQLTQRDPNELLDGLPEAADGLVAGRGRIEGVSTYVAADDPTVIAGTRGLVAERKQERVMRLAIAGRAPFVWLQEASAGRFQEINGPEFAVFGGREFRSHLDMVGRVPIVAASFGPGFGGPTFRSIIADFSVVVRGQTYLGISGPPMVAAATGERRTAEEIGGADVAAGELGIADVVAENDGDAIAYVQDFLGYMPSSCWELPEWVDAGDAARRDCPRLEQVVPAEQRRGYDMRAVLREVVDGGEYFELKREYGRSAITCLARIGGFTVGIIANQPMIGAGVIDAPAATKMISFIQRCDAFNIPLLFLQDQPGVMLGTAADRSGLATLATRLVMTIARTVVPRLSVVIRKAYGLGFMAMSGRALDPDLFAVWPSANMTAIGTGPVVETLFGSRIRDAEDPDEMRRQLTEEFAQRADPFISARAGYVDAMIRPSQTRNVVIEALEAGFSRLESVRGPKHPIVP